MKTSDRTSESGFVCTTSSLQTEVLMFIYKIAVEEGKKTNGLIEGCLQWIQLWMAVLHTQHCHYYNFFKSYKKKRKNENYARVHKKSPGCFSTHTHTRAHTVKADSEQRFLSSLVFSATLQTASWKVFCHLTKLNVTVLDYKDIVGFLLTSSGQSNL